MKSSVDTIKKKFRDGRRDDAIAQCEAECVQHPDDAELKRLCAMMHALTQNYGRALALLRQVRDPGQENADVLFNIGQCERELKDFEAAQRSFATYTQCFPGHPDGWAGLAECKFQLGAFSDGVLMADQALKLDASSVPAWTVRGNCQRSLGQFQDALASYRSANRLQPTGEGFYQAGLAQAQANNPAEAIDSFAEAIRLAPGLAKARVARGDVLDSVGKIPEAIADYEAALVLAPDDGETLKKVTTCLLVSNRGDRALSLCRSILAARPDMLTARLGAEWVLSQMVPLWHIPMMNEPERNQAYHDGLKAAVTPDTTVFEIGTGAGLIAMMAARLGVRSVVTCEAVGLIAETAATIVRRNGYQDRITVLAKPSQAVQVPADLPAKSDILVHEIFSSELLGENVLASIEDAKRRLLKPGGTVLPAAASIMIALVGGDDLGMNLHVGESFGFDLSDFNAIHPKKRPLYREDLAPILLSEAVEAFRFDFANDSDFPARSMCLDLGATQDGLCYGVIQWIRIDMGEGIRFENHPARRRPVSNWQQTVYGFDDPVRLTRGSAVRLAATHDRTRPWFSLAPTQRDPQA